MCWFGSGGIVTSLFAASSLYSAVHGSVTRKRWSENLAARALPANLVGSKFREGQIEIYDQAKYFAVTAKIFQSAPLEIKDGSDDVRALLSARRFVRPIKRPSSRQCADA